MNRLQRSARRYGVALLLTLAGPALAQLPAPEPGDGPRPRPSARPLPSAARERLERLKEKRMERLRERQQQREKLQKLSDEYETALARPNATPKLLKEKHDALLAARDERRRERRMELRRRYGVAVAEPAVRTELELHARRAARLKQLRFLAAAEHTGKRRAELLARVEKLLESENERHERKMRVLVPAQRIEPVVAASGVPAAAARMPALPPAASGAKR